MLGSLLDRLDSVLSSQLVRTVASINNSTSVLPHTRLDLHTIYTDTRDMLTAHQVGTGQIYTAKNSIPIISDLLRYRKIKNDGASHRRHCFILTAPVFLILTLLFLSSKQIL